MSATTTRAVRVGAVVLAQLVLVGEVWVGGSVQRTPPADGLYLTCDDSSWQLECGIESWFLPQDEAAGLQDAIGSGTAVATVKVDAAGHAALVDVTTP